MFRRKHANLQKEETVPLQKVPEVMLPEASGAPETTSLETPQMSSEQQVGTTERTVVAEDGDMNGASAVEFSVLLAPVQTQLAHLEELFQEKIREDDKQRQLFERLMNDLDKYRQDFIFSHITSKVFRDLIQLYDTLEQTLQPDAVEGATREALLSRLGSFRQQVMHTLQRQEVELVESTLGVPFDESRQEAINVRVVERPEEDGIVVEIIRHGFRYRERLLRPEWVIVGRYQKK